MLFLVEEEESVKEMQEPVFVERLSKLLMLSVNHRLNVVKLNELKRNLGFPDDYLIRILPKYPDTFRFVNHSGRRSSMEIELLSWNPDLAISAVEVSARKQGSSKPCFSCSLPSTWVKSWERFNEFNATPYISPYVDSRGLLEGSKEMEKRIVGLVHELLSLTLWKKMSIVKLGHFKREFNLPEKLNILLLKHPGIFYVSNKYQIYTVLLREGYNGSELIDKDPLVVVKDKFGELMQEGLHEYNRRRYEVNLEKQRKKGIVSVRKEKRKEGSTEMTEQDDSGDKLGVLDVANGSTGDVLYFIVLLRIKIVILQSSAPVKYAEKAPFEIHEQLTDFQFLVGSYMNTMSCRANNSVALAAPTRLVKSPFETAGGRKHTNPLCLADEEPVDPKKYLEEACKPKCVRPLLEYQACVKRIQGDESGHKHCTGQYFDYWSCVDKCACVKRVEGDDSSQKHCTGQYFDYWFCIDKCVAPKLLSKLK
ncbi:protein ROOT PRIMORDIUM DEFECTIVE 1 [Populus alba x Populus x berolinensis]|nr:protein ROOT PRIMORDIUM DEFECTIVE 1 [Populus alba x Populus x berolinensis]